MLVLSITCNSDATSKGAPSIGYIGPAQAGMPSPQLKVVSPADVVGGPLIVPGVSLVVIPSVAVVVIPSVAVPVCTVPSSPHAKASMLNPEHAKKQRNLKFNIVIPAWRIACVVHFCSFRTSGERLIASR
jgi:hypothetical protein